MLEIDGQTMKPRQGLGWAPFWLEVGVAENATWEIEGGFLNYTTYVMSK